MRLKGKLHWQPSKDFVRHYAVFVFLVTEMGTEIGYVAQIDENSTESEYGIVRIDSGGYEWERVKLGISESMRSAKQMLQKELCEE